MIVCDHNNVNCSNGNICDHTAITILLIIMIILMAMIMIIIIMIITFITITYERMYDSIFNDY